MLPLSTCLVSSPLGKKRDLSSQVEIDFDRIYFECIKPAVEELKIKCSRLDELHLGAVIHKTTIEALVQSDIVISDLTTHNANVLYELGIRHALRRNLTIPIFAGGPLPFDLNIVHCIFYRLENGQLSPDSCRGLQEAIVKRIKAAADGSVSTSPVHIFLPQLDINVAKSPCVFIGHGRSPLWSQVERFIERELNIATVDYESEPHAGESIVPILEGMLQKATFAVLILTAEDETRQGSKRARQNVIHEAGLFQGLLGFRRAIILRQEGVEEFSNVAGLQYISFAGDNIDQTFWPLRQVLKREGMLPNL
jgi:hypothetical protein